MRVPRRHPDWALQRRWRPTDVMTMVVVVCYGAAALVIAAGLFVRLVR